MRTFWVNGLNKMGLESGTYVLASEANERIKVLDETNTKLCNDFNDMAEEHGFDQFEISVLKTDIEVLVKRIKLLEGALKLEREECAKIAEKYEPDEKLDYVTYASREIRLRCAALEVK